ncbi:hypothetical protein GCM10010273_31250 [Streptomyces lavendulocolor]
MGVRRVPPPPAGADGPRIPGLRPVPGALSGSPEWADLLDVGPVPYSSTEAKDRWSLLRSSESRRPKDPLAADDPRR